MQKLQVVIPVGYRENFPITKKPQTFLPLLNREMFSQILSKLSDHEVIVVTPFTKEFKKYDVQVIKDEGTGSASSLKSVEKILDGPFVVHFSDVYTPFKPDALFEFHQEKQPLVSLAVYPSNQPSRYGVVSKGPDGQVAKFLFRPRTDLVFSNLVSAGIYVFDPEVFDKIPYKMNVHELMFYLVQKRSPVFAKEFKGVWYQLGSRESYVEANSNFLQRRMDMRQEGVKGVNSFPPVNLVDIKAKLAMIGPNVSANNVKMGEHITITDSVILPGAKIGNNVKISDSIIGPKVKIGNNVAITESLVGEGSRIGDNVKIGKSVIGLEREIMENVFEVELH
ncbi:MAG: NDP-sugar synthase [Candidatus Altiarchaeota archaeon]|nr:NDP-sugar synthase [Candidatus Altiarchaeota archaeon]